MNVRRITIRRSEQVFPTKHIIITFSTCALLYLSELAVVYLSFNVWCYIHNPLSYFKFKNYGHSKASLSVFYVQMSVTEMKTVKMKNSVSIVKVTILSSEYFAVDGYLKKKLRL